MSIGERIKIARKKAGFTQKELAEKSGMATVSVQQYERGVRQPRIEQLQAIAGVLGVTTESLIGPVDGSNITIKPSPELAKILGIPENIEITGNSSLANYVLLEFKSGDLRKRKIDAAFQILNADGQQKAVERVEELTEIPRYRRSDTPPEGNAPTPAAPPPESAENSE